MKAMKCMLVLAAVILIPATGLGRERADSEQERQTTLVVEGNNRFALKLYAKLREADGNLFFSPYSISTALAMAHAGARGRTEAQMAKVLHFPTAGEASGSDSDHPAGKQPPWTREQFAATFGAIIESLNDRGAEGEYQLNVANALWGQKGYGFLQEFLELVEANYDGRLSEVDFVRAAEQTRNKINAWVEKKTNNKIKDLIPRGVLDAMTRLVLTNAIYFKGNWENQFEEAMTRPAPFTLLSGDKVDVPMMNQTEEFRYMEVEAVQGLELPYADNELSMIILLPRELGGLRDLEKDLTQENLSQWLGTLGKRRVIVSVPKFKMTSQFGLASVLRSMGMTDAFAPGLADFSGMNAKRDLFISAVIHKAYVEVNEEGTEAAAATAVIMNRLSVRPTQPAVFCADHPFLFLIRDNHTGSILFIGRVMNPKA
ncbi:MAG: serpin family protein [Phycisphaerales bacterium]|nr:MAG: serpin family protein [Phycisphaerales bacterium]